MSIKKEELEDWEIFAGVSQRATDFRYNASIGISYTFGSIYNNVVNTRLGGGGGGYGGSGGRR